jgi:uncharacterized membrane protein YbhN (UPF0104 family)
LKLVPYGITLVLLVGIALHSDGFSVASKARWDYLAAAIVLSLLLNVGLASVKLWALMRAFGLSIPLGRVVRMIMGLLPATFFMPFQSGHVLYAVALQGEEQVDTVAAIETIAFDKYLTLMGTFVLVFVGWCLLPSGHFLAQPWIPIAAAAGVATLWLGRPIRALIRRVRFLRDRSMMVERSLGTPRKLGLLAMATVYQASDVATMWFACRALGIEIDALLLVGVFPVVLLLSYLPVTISGLGIREPLVAMFYAGTLTRGQGIGAGLLIDLVEYVVPALFGILALPALLRALRGSFARTH